MRLRGSWPNHGEPVLSVKRGEWVLVEDVTVYDGRVVVVIGVTAVIRVKCQDGGGGLTAPPSLPVASLASMRSRWMSRTALPRPPNGRVRRRRRRLGGGRSRRALPDRLVAWTSNPSVSVASGRSAARRAPDRASRRRSLGAGRGRSPRSPRRERRRGWRRRGSLSPVCRLCPVLRQAADPPPDPPWAPSADRA